MGILIPSASPKRADNKKEVPKLTSFKLLVSDVMLGETQGTKYMWIDDNGEPVAKFITFDWWDGKNISDLRIYYKYRKKGYSYQLLDYATKRIGCKALAVRRDNDIARHTYEKYGFRIVDQDEKLYYMSI